MSARAAARLLAALLLALAAPGCALREPAPAWEQPAPPVEPGPVVDASRVHRGELPNGAHTLVLEDRGLPLVTLAVTVRRGAGLAPPGREGLAVYTAELMERGAGEWGALELAERVDAMGASLSVQADWDAMEVRVTGLSRDLERLLGILADVTLRPRFESGEAEKVRAEQIASLARALDEPRTLASRQLARSLYGEHPYGAPIAGTPESVGRLDADVARAFHARVFVARNAILWASGDVDPGALEDAFRQRFGQWQAGEVPPEGSAPPAPTPAERRVVIVDRPDLDQAQILLGHEGIARTHSERIAASLLETVLGSGGFSSRLMTQVRAEAGLSYSAYAAFVMRRQPGPFLASTFTRVPEVRRTVDLLLEVVGEAGTRPPDAAELRHAKSNQVGRFLLSLETPAAVASALVRLDVYGLPDDALDTYRERVRAVTVEDTARLARQLLHPERMAVVVVGPADPLRDALASLGPVEVVQP